MRQQKKPNKKERNYSIWFTGLILVLVYMILLEDASGTEKSACKSILKERILAETEYVLEMSQEKEEEALSDLEEKQGIESWQPEELSQEEKEAIWKQEGEEILRRFREVDWEQIEPGPLEYGPIEERTIIYLASIPEKGIYLYGYNDEEFQGRGVAVEFRTAEGSRYFYYDWGYLTPRLIMPELFWNEKEKQLYISLYVGSGTGFAVEELHILQCSETEPPIDFEFMREDYLQQLEERFSCTVDPEKDELIVYDKGQAVIESTLSQWWVREEENVLGLSWGNIVQYHFEKQLQMEVPVGLRTDKRADAAYSDSDNYNFYINIDHHIETSPSGDQQMVFILGDVTVEREE